MIASPGKYQAILIVLIKKDHIDIGKSIRKLKPVPCVASFMAMKSIHHGFYLQFYLLDKINDCILCVMYDRDIY